MNISITSKKLSFVCRDPATDRLKAPQGLQMKVSKRMKMNTVKHYVAAVVETTMRMNSGSAVTYASGGSTGNV